MPFCPASDITGLAGILDFHSLALLDYGERGHIVRKPDVTAYNSVMADGDASQN